MAQKKIRTRKEKCQKCQEIFEVPGPGCECLQKFSFPIQVGAGGCERPFIMNGQWFIRVWNCHTREYFNYSYGQDLFLAEDHSF